MDKTIKVGSYEIKWLPKDKNNFIDKTTLIFGGSNSGKTTIIEEVLFMVKDDIPNYLFVANPSSVGTYMKKIPPICILNDLTPTIMTAIWQRQSNLTECYNIANNIDILESIYNKIPNGYKKKISDIEQFCKKCTEDVNNSKELSFDKKKVLIANINDMTLKNKKILFKNTIRDNYALIKSSIDSFNLNEKVAIEYLDINPRLMIILDDVSDKFKLWMKMFKQEKNPFESIFFQGRHNFITFLFAAHDDTIIPPQLRKNARTVIYTTSQSLMTSFSRTGNGYSKQEKKLVETIIPSIFGDEARSEKTYKKICYIRDDPSPFSYTIANTSYPDFKLGDSNLYKLIDILPKKEDNIVNNPLVKHML